MWDPPVYRLGLTYRNKNGKWNENPKHSNIVFPSCFSGIFSPAKTYKGRSPTYELQMMRFLLLNLNKTMIFHYTKNQYFFVSGWIYLGFIFVSWFLCLDTDVLETFKVGPKEEHVFNEQGKTHPPSCWSYISILCILFYSNYYTCLFWLHHFV